MSPFFKKKFDATKCKTMLQLTIQRIKVLRNKNSVSINKIRGDIAKLLDSDRDSYNSAAVMVEHLLREMKVNNAYDLIEHYCQTTINQLEIIKSHKECPIVSKEAITSLLYAAEHCTDLQELKKVQKMFMAKYGSEFLHAATYLRSDCGVNPQMVEKLSLQPSRNPEIKQKLLKEIAEEYKLNWNHGNDTVGDSNLNTLLSVSSNQGLTASKSGTISEKNQSLFLNDNEGKGRGIYRATSDSNTYKGDGGKINDETITNKEEDGEVNVMDGCQNIRNLDACLKPGSHEFMNGAQVSVNRRTESKGVVEAKSVLDLETAAKAAFISASEAAEAAKAALIMLGTISDEKMHTKGKPRVQVIEKEKEALSDENVSSNSSNVDNAGLAVKSEEGKQMDGCYEITDLKQVCFVGTCWRDEHGEYPDSHVSNEEDNYKDVSKAVWLDASMLPRFDNLEDASEIARYDVDHESEVEVLTIEHGEHLDTEMPKFDRHESDLEMPQYDRNEDGADTRPEFDQHEDGPQFDEQEHLSEMLKCGQCEYGQEELQYENCDDGLKTSRSVEHKTDRKQPRFDEYASDDPIFDTERRGDSKEGSPVLEKQQYNSHMLPVKSTDFHTSESVQSPSDKFVHSNRHRTCVGSCQYDDDYDSVGRSTPGEDAKVMCMAGGGERYSKSLRKLKWVSKNTGPCDSLDTDDDNGIRTVRTPLEPLHFLRDPEEDQSFPSTSQPDQKSTSLVSEGWSSDSVSPSFCRSRGYLFTTRAWNSQDSFVKPRRGLSVRSTRTTQHGVIPSPDSRPDDSTIG